ncbi:nucleotidyltransferase domain-containing protein [Desulfobacca acetoxidans]|nr:nucleotidyltransferase family protein [Desulfobacca acetoxidans]
MEKKPRSESTKRLADPFNRFFPGDNFVRENFKLDRTAMPPELQLVLACLRKAPHEQEVQQIERLSRGKIAWPDFLRWVDRHRVAPLVYENLRRYGGNGVPGAVRNALRSRFESNAQRSLINAAELLRLHTLLRENNIPCIPLKGSLLALQVYGNLALRHAGDIDLLVDRNHVDRADLLLRQDYSRLSPGPYLTPFQKRAFCRLQEHLVYTHESKKVKLELHSRLFYNRPYCATDFTRLLERLQSITVANSSLLAMPLEDTVLYLADHGGQHNWSRLFWLNDLAEIIRWNWLPDWDALLAGALEKGVTRPLVQGVVLAHHLLQAPLPEAIQAHAAQDRMVNYLVDAALRRICTLEQQKPPITEILYGNIIHRSRLYSEVKYKIKVMQRVLLYSRDWGTIRLPDIAFPTFFMMRPFLWLYRKLGRYREKSGRRRTEGRNT